MGPLWHVYGTCETRYAGRYPQSYTMGIQSPGKQIKAICPIFRPALAHLLTSTIKQCCLYGNISLFIIPFIHAIDLRTDKGFSLSDISQLSSALQHKIQTK